MTKKREMHEIVTNYLKIGFVYNTYMCQLIRFGDKRKMEKKIEGSRRRETKKRENTRIGKRKKTRGSEEKREEKKEEEEKNNGKKACELSLCRSLKFSLTF